MQRIFFNPRPSSSSSSSSSPQFHVLPVQTQFLTCVDPAWRPRPLIFHLHLDLQLCFSSPSLPKNQTWQVTVAWRQLGVTTWSGCRRATRAPFFFFFPEEHHADVGRCIHTFFLFCVLCVLQLRSSFKQAFSKKKTKSQSAHDEMEEMSDSLPSSPKLQHDNRQGSVATLRSSPSTTEWVFHTAAVASYSFSPWWLACFVARKLETDTSCCCFLPPLFHF